MIHDTVIGIEALRSRLEDPDWVVADCRFDLADPGAGERAYLEAHVAGAIHAHLDRDLSGSIRPGVTGRHPLPEVDRLAETLGSWGIDARVQVVAYDDRGGAFAARLWWLLRWLGHDAVAVLDGGWPAWLEAGAPVRSGRERRPPRRFTPRPRPEMVVSAEEAAAIAADPAGRLLDARGADRYRGENETIDPVAGHIPGARSAPFADNLDPEGRFRAPDELRRHYDTLLEGIPPRQVAAYCGSGVTGAHDLLAMAHAGLDGARLFAGSWSEWITDPARPVATGEEPVGADEVADRRSDDGDDRASRPDPDQTSRDPRPGAGSSARST